MTPALSSAQAPPTEAELVRIPVRVLRQCEQDAARVDGLEARLRACQRSLDASAGALTEAQRSSLEARVEVARLTLRVAALERERAERWSPWAWMGIGVGASLVTLATILAVR